MTTTTRTNWKDKAQTLASKMGIAIYAWNPGDGVTIKLSLVTNVDYFGLSEYEVLFRSRSWQGVYTFLQGFVSGVHAQMQDTE